ncbi:flippase-like domain-containing protein [archaeon]|nr:flippase-like domain-containing protein [archaeon]
MPKRTLYMKTQTMLALTLISGIVIGVVIFFLAGLKQTLAILADANLFLIALATICQLLSIVAIFWRWRITVNFVKIKVSRSLLFLASLAGIAFANITPSSRMGGEPVRVYFLRKNTKAHTGDALATVVAERVFEGVTFTFISLAVLLLSLMFWHLQWWVVVLMMLSFAISSAFIGFVVYMSYNRKAGLGLVLWLLNRFRKFVGKERTMRRLQNAITRNVSFYNKNVKKMLANRTLWANAVLFSFVNWAFEVLRAYFILLALGANNPSLLVVAAAIVISALGGALPLLPGGLGIMEGTMIVILSSAGIPPALAGAATIVDRLISYWATTFGGLGSAYYIGIRQRGSDAGRHNK